MDEHEPELTEAERHALDAWPPLAPPAGFAERVLEARDVAAPRRRRWPLVAAAATLSTAAAAATLVFALRPADRAARGELTATVRTTSRLGDRAIAVAEPTATLTWQIDDDGDAVIEQRAGDVFYRVEPGGAFVVHTPAGDVHVTGTCFRIEVEPMNKREQLLLSGTIGAILATGIVITVYEGRVIADTGGARTEVVAGHRAALGGGQAVVATGEVDARGGGVPGVLPDERRASRQELLARTVAQRTEIAKLRDQVAQLEARRPGHHDSTAEPGRAWHDPSEERLAEWARECHVRSDEPGFDMWRPQTSLGKNERGLEPGELTAYNAALAEVQQAWKALVRALYLEATGDAAGVDVLSLDAMRSEIQQKGSPDEHNLVLQRIANERAGLAQPPADLSRTSPYERMMRAYLELGDQTEAALAKRLGPERAAAIRGDAWGSRSDWSGCPGQ